MKLKILYTITQGHWGGAQKYVADLALHLSQQADYEVTVACGEQNKGLFAVLKNSPVKTIQLRHLVRAINPLKDVLALNEIIGILKTGQFDIVHANSSKAGFLTAMGHAWLHATKKSIYKTKCVYTAHGWVFMEPLAPPMRWIFLLMERIARRLRNATIVLSQKEKNIALQYCAAREDSLFVIPNGIDCALIDFFDKNTARGKIFEPHGEITSTNGHPWIGTIANLYKTKGIEVLIHAATALHEQNKNNEHTTPFFFVIGDGPERPRLQNLIQKLNLSDSFFLVGAIKEAARYLKAFDLFVLPSLKEGFPYTILEASCAGIPIIASDVGAIPEIIHNKENGLITPHGDSTQLANAITQTLNNSELYTKLKPSARQIAEKFSLEKTIEQTKNLYLKLKRDK